MDSYKELTERQKLLQDELVELILEIVRTDLAPERIVEVLEKHKQQRSSVRKLEITARTCMEDLISTRYYKYTDDLYNFCFDLSLLHNLNKVASTCLEKLRMQEEVKKECAELKQQIEQLQEEIENSNKIHCANAAELKKVGDFRREVSKFRLSLLEQEADPVTLSSLESNKHLWQAQLETIRELYVQMKEEHETTEDVDEEYSLIEKEFDFVYQAKAKEISRLTETKHVHSTRDIKVPNFAGETSEWLSFYNSFKETVDENINLSQVQKLECLRNVLRGEAFKLIKKMKVVSENYELAWNKVVQKYGPKDVMVKNFIDYILDQPKISNKSPIEFYGLMNTAVQCMSTLEILKLNGDDIEPILARIIAKKLDKESLERFELAAKQKSGEMHMLADVYKFLQVEQGSALLLGPSKTADQTPQAAAVKSQLPCLYCRKSGHETAYCFLFLAISPRDRYAWARNERICLNCLSHDKNTECKSARRCEICYSLHHTIIHTSEIDEKIASSSLACLLYAAYPQCPSYPGYPAYPAANDQSLNNHMPHLAKETTNKATCATKSTSAPSSSKQEMPAETTDVFTKRSFPPAAKPAGQLKIKELEILADYLNFTWRPENFESYHKLIDSGLYNKAWEMLDNAADNLIAQKLPRLKILFKNPAKATLTQFMDVVEGCSILKSHSSELQEILSVMQGSITKFQSTAVQLIEGKGGASVVVLSSGQEDSYSSEDCCSGTSSDCD